jgi:hypothetical protein
MYWRIVSRKLPRGHPRNFICCTKIYRVSAFHIPPRSRTRVKLTNDSSLSPLLLAYIHSWISYTSVFYSNFQVWKLRCVVFVGAKCPVHRFFFWLLPCDKVRFPASWDQYHHSPCAQRWPFVSFDVWPNMPPLVLFYFIFVFILSHASFFSFCGHRKEGIISFVK